MNKNMKNKNYSNYIIPTSILISSLVIAVTLVYMIGAKNDDTQETKTSINSTNELTQALEDSVLPSEGFVLPVVWGDLGKRLVNSGTIDIKKINAIYEEGGTFTDEYKELLLGQNESKLKITNWNAGYLLNLFWALGLSNKNTILELGEMTDPSYGGPQNFASTGGWTISNGNPMDHYSHYVFFTLTPEQQMLVDRISNGIYRPCCNNSTHFPDCNHGMAMLGLLELMASQGVSESDMWSTALTVNSYWFPDTYLTIATYMKNNGIRWNNVSPQEILSADYSSASGYKRVALQVTKPKQQGGSSCSVN